MLKVIVSFILLVAVSCGGVWVVEVYINQDGTPHLYNAYLILEILKGNDPVSQFAAINPQAIPNLTGHWLLAGLLLIFHPITTTKIMVTLTFAAFVASFGWLRFQVAGRDGLGTSLLIAGCIAFNWMWFLGFYNFILALSLFSFSAGLWWKWRDRMNSVRALCLFILLVLTFFSHLISFGILIAAILFLCATQFKTIPRKSLVWTIATIAATIPLAINFLTISKTGGSLFPQWRYLADPFSISEWLTRFSAGDPFVLISRKALPFIECTSVGFAVFSPALWMAVAFLIFAFSTFRNKHAVFEGKRFAWAIISLGLFLVWAVGPDDFGSSHGGFLRERALILSLVCLIPILHISKRTYTTTIASACLVFVILFQALVLWEYSIKTNAIANRFLAASVNIADKDSLASVVFIEETVRFRPIPLSNLTAFLGLGKSAPVWDNYELGYYLFPVTAKTKEVQKFVFAYRESSIYELDRSDKDITEKLRELETVLAENHHLIDILLVWNEQAGFAKVREKWFEPKPYFESNEVRLYRHF